MTCHPLHKYHQDLWTVSIGALLPPWFHSSLWQSSNPRSTTCCRTKSWDVIRCAVQLSVGCKDGDAENLRWIDSCQQHVSCFRDGGVEALNGHCFTLTFSQPVSSKWVIKFAKIIHHLPFHHMSHSLWPCLCSTLGSSPRSSSNHHSQSCTRY